MNWIGGAGRRIREQRREAERRQRRRGGGVCHHLFEHGPQQQQQRRSTAATTQPQYTSTLLTSLQRTSLDQASPFLLQLVHQMEIGVSQVEQQPVDMYLNESGSGSGGESESLSRLEQTLDQSVPVLLQCRKRLDFGVIGDGQSSAVVPSSTSSPVNDYFNLRNSSTMSSTMTSTSLDSSQYFSCTNDGLQVYVDQLDRHSTTVTELSFHHQQGLSCASSSFGSETSGSSEEEEQELSSDKDETIYSCKYFGSRQVEDEPNSPNNATFYLNCTLDELTTPPPLSCSTPKSATTTTT